MFHEEEIKAEVGVLCGGLEILFFLWIITSVTPDKILLMPLPEGFSGYYSTYHLIYNHL